jgi:hypothetical protein
MCLYLFWLFYDGDRVMKEPWQMTKKEWEAAMRAASKAEIAALKAPAGSEIQKRYLWGTAERLRLTAGVEPRPIRPNGVPVVTYEMVKEAARQRDQRDSQQ